MARYIVNTSRFRPMEFQEMLQPVLAAEEAHMNVENQLGELREKAGVWENMANQASDPQAYNMYKTYADDLRSQVDALSREGLTPSTRSGLQSMRERYSSEIIPIETAYTTRAEQIAQQREIEMKDPTARHTRSAATTSLDSYLADPTLSYRSVSGAQLASQVSTVAQSLAKEIRDNPAQYRPILGGQQYEAIIRSGFSPDEINAAIRGDKGANPLLSQIVDDALHSAGISDFNQATQNELRALASQGLYSAVGEDRFQLVNNKDWDIRANLQSQMALLKYKDDLARDLMDYQAGIEGLEQPRKPYSEIPIAQADKGFVKDYGGKRLQRGLDAVEELRTTNPHNITEQEIAEMTAIRAPILKDQAGWRAARGTAGALDPELGDHSSPGRTEKEKALVEIADAMNLYQVDNLEDLELSMQAASEMNARLSNSYRLDLEKMTDTKQAMEKLKHDIGASYGLKGQPLRKVTSRGVQGKPVSQSDAMKMLEDNKTKSLVYDTSIDEMVLTYDGDKYIIDPMVFGDTFNTFIKGSDKSPGLKHINPRNIPREDEEGNLKPFPEYYKEVALASTQYDMILKDSRNSFLNLWNAYFNE